jgi:PEGA domain
MSAPATELPSSSVSSSGHVDGLGRRSLAFDRATGDMLERLHVRPELAVFEHLIRERIERLATLEDERFARPSGVERDPATGELTVLAEYINGIRLSDFLETSYEASLVPGIDVALGFLLESLPALSTIHTVSGLTHGLIDPCRTVLAPGGQVVFTDAAMGAAAERLHFSRQRLWTEFGVAIPPLAGSVRFDATADITQVALNALMLILGRRLRVEEYPEALPSLLMEVVEVAHIRGSTGFAGGLQRILQRSLPLPGRRPYSTADEAVVDVRLLVRREIGLDVCRQALVDFVEHIDASFSADVPHSFTTAASSQALLEEAADLVELVGDDEESPADEEESSASDEYYAQASEDDAPLDDDALEMVISLDRLDTPVAEDPEFAYELSALDLVNSEADVPPAAAWTEEPEYSTSVEDEVAAAPEPESRAEASHAAVAEEVVSSYAAEPAPVFEESAVSTPPKEPEPVVVATPDPVAKFEEPPAAVDSFETFEEVVATDAPNPEPEREPEERLSGRRKRHQQKSARARKDKLRSTTTVAPQPPVAPKEPPPNRGGSPSGWLVSPQRAAAFEPPVTTPPAPSVPAVPAPPQARPMPVPLVPSFAPTLVGPIPQQSIAPPAPPMPVYNPPVPVTPPVPRPSQVAPVQPVAQSTAPLKLKSEPPAGFTATRKPIPIEPVVSAPPRGSLFQSEEPRAFPWKLAAAAVVIAAIAILVGRTYLPGREAVAGEPGARAAAATPPAPVSAPDGKDKKEEAIPAGKGRLAIQTQPPGIKVLLDRKPVGETPVTIDAPAGRRILTFLTSGGEVMHSVRVAAGKTTTLDLPVFSGWVAVFAPVVMDIAENGQSIGTTEQNRIMLPPGRHELTFSNRELGYSSTQPVDIEPGGVRSVSLQARGTANLNAVPWADVWLDGQKLGETPLANAQVAIGLREFIFKHPQHGERRVTATIRANETTPVTVDFTK